MAEIRPGLLSPDAADTLNSAVEDVARIQFDLEQARKDDDFDFPAKVTAAWYDHETDMWLCDWVEQYFDSKGRRVDLEGGRFGNTLHAPAVPIGNGSPPATFPAEVRLSFRSFNETKGPIYEFAWGGTSLGWIYFELLETLTIDMGMVSAKVLSFWGGGDPGGLLFVHNIVASNKHIFSGAIGHRGIAVWNDVGLYFVIVQLECP